MEQGISYKSTDPDDPQCVIGYRTGIQVISGVLTGDFVTLIRHKKTTVSPLVRIHAGEPESENVHVLEDLTLLAYLTVEPMEGNAVRVEGLIGHSFEAYKDYFHYHGSAVAVRAQLTLKTGINGAVFIVPYMTITQIKRGTLCAPTS